MVTLLLGVGVAAAAGVGEGRNWNGSDCQFVRATVAVVMKEKSEVISGEGEVWWHW